MKNAVYHKVLVIVVIICLIFASASLLFRPVRGNQRIGTNANISEKKQNIAQKYVSSSMTFDEAVNAFAKNTGMSPDKAYESFFGGNPKKNGTEETYRIIDVPVEVTESYGVLLKLFCQVQSGDDSQISEICTAQLANKEGTALKPFNGDIKVWLRGNNAVEYVINGDFFNSGTAVVTGSLGQGEEDRELFIRSVVHDSSMNAEYLYEHNKIYI